MKRVKGNRGWIVAAFTILHGGGDSTFRCRTVNPVASTFDWAPKQEGNDDFERWGESEFVVASETPATFVSAKSSAAYCAP